MDKSVLNEFIGECFEILQRISDAFSAIEKGDSTENHIDAIYRDFHTLKGTAHLFGYQQIGDISHIIESSLGPIRSNNIKFDTKFIDYIYKNIDFIEKMVKVLQDDNENNLDSFSSELNKNAKEFVLYTIDFYQLSSVELPIEFLNEIQQMQKIAPESPKVSNVTPSAEEIDQNFCTESQYSTNSIMNENVNETENNDENAQSKILAEANLEATDKNVILDIEDKLNNLNQIDESFLATMEIKKNKTIKSLSKIEESIISEPSPTNKKVIISEDNNPLPKKEKNMENTAQAISTVENISTTNEKKDSPHSVDSTVRVAVEVLDRLMNLTGELVLVRNQVIQYRNRTEEAELVSLSKSLDLVTSDLQNEVMKTRMQPVGNIFTKFQRVVRDLSRDLNKQIDLTIQGAETELDKTLLESIKDPLTHIVRNSCDHGIESVEDRKIAGKPVNGHISLRAFYEGGQVIIEVSDDGKGLDKNRLISKALEKGLITNERADKISEREAFSLIFMPGFSTAQQVTSVSGRGVGMDVVKTNIEKIGGSVELSSRFGKGTTIQLKIPLTLAIVPALIVKLENARYAIPQVKLVELVRVDPDEGKKIEYIQEKPMFRLRGDLLPLVSLNQVLNKVQIKKSSLKDQVVNVVVLDAEGEKFGLIVDDILDTTDIVVKPLAQFLRKYGTFSGATIMGDGTVSLILDVIGLANLSHFTTGANKKQSSFDENQLGHQNEPLSDSQEFLLIKTLANEIHSIPLCLVQRLEELPVDEIKISGKQKLIQYRSSILPLIDCNEFLGYSVANSVDQNSIPGSKFAPVVVIQKSGKSYGIIVNEIIDIVSIDASIDDSIQDRKGILGNLLFENNILIVLDVLGIIDQVFFKNLKNTKQENHSAHIGNDNEGKLSELKKLNAESQNRKKKILFAEDVVFFRRQVTKVLTKYGLEAVAAENGEQALKILESHPNDFSLVLSDIEMPKMNGLELARAIRTKKEFDNIPMIALTTRFKDSDIKKGIESGFNLYLEKLNEDKLISGIEKFITVVRDQ